MAKRVSPTAVGLFVVASFAILVAAVVVVGSGRMFRKPLLFVCMFSGDLNGLKTGAAVKFRGVQIGSVVAIRLGLSPSEGRLRQHAGGIRLPVIIELDRTQVITRGGGQAFKEGLERSIARGLRAQLRIESLLTGLLYVDLDLHPGTPIDLVLEPGGTYREIPTTPTKLEAIQEQATRALVKLQQIDFEALATSITNAANAIRTLANSPSLKAALDSLNETTASLNRAAISIRVAAEHANSRIDPLVASLRNNSERANTAMEQTRATLSNLQAQLDPGSPLMVHLNQALEQITDTMRTVDDLASYLQRNPAALVRGKYAPDKER